MKVYHFINIKSDNPFSVERDVLDFLNENNIHDDLTFEVVGILGADGKEYNNETIFDLESAYYRVWATLQPSTEESSAFATAMTEEVDGAISSVDSDTWALAARFCHKRSKLVMLGSDIFAGACNPGMYLWEGVTRIDTSQEGERYIAILEVESI